MKATGMKLKVACRKIRRRVRVLLGNIYRLNALWNLLHPGEPMQYISIDQKPSWFNSAGFTRAYGQKGGGAPEIHEEHK